MITQDDFSDIVRQLGQHREWQSGAWANVIDSARKVGLMKAFGVRMENNVATQLNAELARSALSYLQEELERDIMIAIRTDSLAGKALLELPK